jgi:hypothetical protein
MPDLPLAKAGGGHIGNNTLPVASGGVTALAAATALGAAVVVAVAVTTALRVVVLFTPGTIAPGLVLDKGVLLTLGVRVICLPVTPDCVVDIGGAKLTCSCMPELLTTCCSGFTSLGGSRIWFGIISCLLELEIAG